MTLQTLRQEAKKHAEKHTDAIYAKPIAWSATNWRYYLIWYGIYKERNKGNQK